ncbi:MAG: CRISPR-associated endonuclease Cas1 [Rhizobium sp.]
MPPTESASVEKSQGGDGLFLAATTFATLWKAWLKVEENGGAAGGDRVTVTGFAARAQNNISRLSHSLRSAGYRPGPYRRVMVPKRSGGERPLDIPCIADRIAQGAVALVLTPRLEPEFEDSSFAYRPGRSVAKAISRVAGLRKQGFTHVVDADITRYFESVRHERLLSLLDRHLEDSRLCDLIALWLEHFSPAERGIPQGSPLSPLLANLYLDALDEAMDGRHARIVRYADDFVILARTAEHAGKALADTRDILAELGLELNDAKTQLASFDQGFRYLGHVLVRSMVMKETVLDDTPPEDAFRLATVDPADTTPGTEATSAIGQDDKLLPRGRYATVRRVLYVLEPGRLLDAKCTHFRVTSSEGELLINLPATRVDRIEIGHDAGASMTAFDLAAATDTEIVRVNGFGETIGRWGGPARGAARLHMAQAANVLDLERRAELARAIVAGKIFNQRALLKRLDRKSSLTALDPVFTRMARLVQFMERGLFGVEEAMGHEGEAAALYWPALGILVNDPQLFGGKRRRRVGLDPFNIITDMLSSMLLRDCASSLEREGLHGGYGILHASADGEDALSYDLAEEFRAPLVEGCAMQLLARKALDLASFTDGANGYRLARAGQAAVIRGYELQMQRAIRDPLSGDSTTWRGMIGRQAARLGEAFVSGEGYRTYRMDY